MRGFAARGDWRDIAVLDAALNLVRMRCVRALIMRIAQTPTARVSGRADVLHPLDRKSVV